MKTSIKVRDVTDYLESLAPPAFQESYDNSGLLVGDPGAEVHGILVTLDCIEAVVEEAVRLKCNVIIAHHPIVFKGLKSLTGKNYVERVVIKAIQHGIAIYAIHTNLDNVHTGVNKKICDQIGLKNTKILLPRKDTLNKLVTFIPTEKSDHVLDALYKAGAGQIGHYKNCSFSVAGTGTFMPDEEANPHVGKAHSQERVPEVRAEVIFPAYLENRVIKALKETHPYEEVAYYVTALMNENQEVGSGMMGELDKPQEPLEFLQNLKKSMNLKVIRHTSIGSQAVQKVAVCGGSGSFLLNKAIQAGAQVFVTADFKYHDFFDADGKIIIADIGHYESEAYTKVLLVDVLIKKFPTFAINFSKTVTNPISYL
jgi:dinuclear metal center YbgI/SA1388 family protein